MSTIPAVANIVVTSTVAYLAEREGVSEAVVWELLAKGHEGAVQQFCQLVKAGVDKACELGMVA